MRWELQEVFQLYFSGTSKIEAEPNIVSRGVNLANIIKTRLHSVLISVPYPGIANGALIGASYSSVHSNYPT